MLGAGASIHARADGDPKQLYKGCTYVWNVFFLERGWVEKVDGRTETG